MTFCASVAQLLDILQAMPVGFESFDPAVVTQGVTTDTRRLQAGEVFLALRGEKFDGHRFLQQATAQGAIATIVDTPDPTVAIPQLVVANTEAAYQAIGGWWRQQFKIPVIGITGSVGKTTTKELIAGILGTAGRVLKTEANFNNEIGVPKTLLQLEDTHDYAVVEMAMRGPGEIAVLARIAQPDIAVITNVGTAHIGRLGSREAIARAKCELLAELPETSIAILNGEQPLLLETAAQVWSGAQVTYGLTAGHLRGTVEDGQIVVDGQRFPVPLPGEHNALNYLAGIAIARHLNLDLAPLQAGLNIQLPGGRAQRITLAPDIVLLDETYNAGAESMTAALKLLRQTPGQRHIAVLGPMKELGSHAEALHHQIGELVATLNLDQLLILDQGPEGTAIAQGASPVPTEQFAAANVLTDYLRQQLQAGDRVLFKASHSVGLNAVVQALQKEQP